MKEIFSFVLYRVETLPQVLERLPRVFDIVRRRYGDNGQIHYVSGIISGDGEERIPYNLFKLNEETLKVRKDWENHIVFSATDVFTPQVYSGLKELRLPREEREESFRNFWAEAITLLEVTDMHLTDGWERSPGARFEKELAESLGIRLHFRQEL